MRSTTSLPLQYLVMQLCRTFISDFKFDVVPKDWNINIAEEKFYATDLIQEEEDDAFFE